MVALAWMLGARAALHGSELARHSPSGRNTWESHLRALHGRPLNPACCAARFEEKSEIADELKIRAVPMFCFFRGGKLVDQFATRERKRVAAAINHHAGHEVLQAS